MPFPKTHHGEGAGALCLDMNPGAVDIWGEVASWPPDCGKAWEEKAAMLEFDAKMARPEGERAAFEMLRGSVGA